MNQDTSNTASRESIQEAIPTSISRIPLLGQRCVYRDRLFEIIDIGANRQLTLRDAESGELVQVDMDEIASLASTGDERCKTTQELARQIKASKRQAVLSNLVDTSRVSIEDLRQAAQTLNVSIRHVQRLLNRLRNAGTRSSLEDRRPGPKDGCTFIDDKAEGVIEEIVVDHLRRSPDIALSQIYPLIESQCRDGLQIPPPSRATVGRRLRLLKRRPEFMSPEARSENLEQRRPVKKHFEAEHALQIVQIDHTIADVMCVDARDRLPVGRPTLTFAIDIGTRCVLGMNVGFEPPSAVATALCLTHAVLPKEDWLRQIGSNAHWPMHGLIHCLHTDNGSDFHGAAIQTGCSEFGISRMFRPPGTPRFGGGIERFNLTMLMRQQHLPGATFSRTLRRRPKNVEGSAALTLDEFKCILANEVNRYHLESHRELGMSPHAAWRRAWENTSGPRVPKDPQQFLMSFLPIARRVVTREGIDLFGLEYWDLSLREFIEPHRQHVLRYDPRDISAVFLQVDTTYHRIALRDKRIPGMSLAEWKELRRRHREHISRQYPPEPDTLVRLLRESRDIVDQASSLRDRQRKARRNDWTKQASPHPKPAVTSSRLKAKKQPEATGVATFEILESDK